MQGLLQILLSTKNEPFLNFKDSGLMFSHGVGGWKRSSKD